MVTDTQRLDWLEEQVNKGACPGLINDDNGHWAVSFNGMQNAVAGEQTADVWTAFHIEAHEWRNTIREAIDAVMTTR